jgi:membrane protein implicated in regulation of membrane protease activity
VAVVLETAVQGLAASVVEAQAQMAGLAELLALSIQVEVAAVKTLVVLLAVQVSLLFATKHKEITCHILQK